MNNIKATVNNMTICTRTDGRYMGRITVNSHRKSFYGKTKTEVKNKAKFLFHNVKNTSILNQHVYLLHMYILHLEINGIDFRTEVRLFNIQL